MRSIQSIFFTLLAASITKAYADTTLNLTPGVSPISHDIYDLHMLIFWICVAIGIVVFGAMFYSMYYHRKSRGHKAAQFHSHPVLEVAWTIIPALILVVMAIPATKVLFNMNDNSKDDLTIKVTGYQWKWQYEYLEDEVKFFSNLSTPYDQIHGSAPKTENYLREVDNPIVVPIHKKIRFLITSNDVNHAWWVPDLGVKRDAIAGLINEAWTRIDKPGLYRGQCAELCGVNHAFMPIVVIATTEQGYKDWIAKQKGQATAGDAEVNKEWTMQELMKNGETVYNRICSACHQPGGVGQPPTFPALKGSKITTGPVEGHIEVVFNGKSGTAMQAFKNQLTDSELASVITYERNAFGNNTNSLVQPIQMKALRDGKSMADALATKPSGDTKAAPAAKAEPAAASPSGPETTPPETKAATPSAPETPASTESKAVTPTATPSAPASVPSAATETKVVAPASGTPTSSEPKVAKTTGGPASNVASPASATVTTVPLSAPAPAATTPVSAPSQSATPATSPSAAPSAATQATPAASTAATPQGANADALKEAMVRGEKVYLATCAACHQPTGLGMPPTFPSLKGSPLVTGPVAGHIERIMNGKTGTAMVPFKDQLKDQEIADVITYERNAWGNNLGTLVTADEIKAARQPGQKQ